MAGRRMMYVQNLKAGTVSDAFRNAASQAVVLHITVIKDCQY